MTDDTKKVLSLGGRPKLELKKPVSADGGGAGSVRQSFSHGRSKTVAVEVKQRKRTEKDGAETSARQQMVKGPEPGTSVSVNERGRATSAVIRQLTNEERDARVRALRGAVLDNEKRDEASSSYMPSSEAGDASAPGSTRDSLRTRELEELRRIQEHEKTETDRKRTEEEARTGVRRGDSDRMRVATRAGDAAAAKMAGIRRGGEDEDEGARRKVGRGAPAPRRGADDARRRRAASRSRKPYPTTKAADGAAVWRPCAAASSVKNARCSSNKSRSRSRAM